MAIRSVPTVALVIGQLELGGGAEGQITELALGLPACGFRPVVISLRAGQAANGEDNYWAHVLRRRGVTVHELKRGGALDLRRVATLARLLRAEQPAIVHSQLFSANAYARTAAILACRGAIRLTSERAGELSANPLQRLANRALQPFTDGVIANADAIRRMLEHLGVRVPIWVVHNGIDAARYDPARRNEARRALGLADDDLIIGIVARISEEKDYPFFLDVVARSVSHVPRLRAIAFGDGPLRPVVETLVRQRRLEGSVRLCGKVPNIPELIPALDVFVLTSRFEGLSNAVMEAQAAAIPAVVTDVGGNGEIVVDGLTGYVVPAGHAELFSSRIVSILTDAGRRSSMATEARRRMEREFTMDQMIRRTADVYRNLLERRPRAQRPVID